MPVPQVHGFPPLAAPDARVLVLGSMPGKASLAANEYYGHPRNAFWPIVEALFGVAAAQPYAQRARGLVASRVAVWDVLKACERETSLDADIVEGSIVPNDLRGFLSTHTAIERVFFNGAKAEQSWRRHVAPTLGPRQAALPTRRLPSTSPAHASLSFDQKLAAWRVLVDG